VQQILEPDFAHPVERLRQQLQRQRQRQRQRRHLS
jgi:hypothetical protein